MFRFFNRMIYIVVILFWFVPLRKTGYLFLLTITLLATVIAFLFLPEALPELYEGEIAHVLTRFFALYGFLFLSVTTLTTPFLREIILAFGKPFIRIHHSFAAIGITLITLHPIFNAIDRVSLSVFVPVFDSWLAFWTFGGRLAFILFYIAIAFALLRNTISKYWRPFHAIVYVVLFFGIVHAFLIGEDFNNIGILTIFSLLFAASIATFTVRQYKNYQMKNRRTSSNIPKKEPTAKTNP